MQVSDEAERAAVIKAAAHASLEVRIGQQPTAYRWRELSVKETRGMPCFYDGSIGYVGDYEPASGMVVVHWPGGRTSWVRTGDVWLLSRKARS